jgi:hypothetical protein
MLGDHTGAVVGMWDQLGVRAAGLLVIPVGGRTMLGDHAGAVVGRWDQLGVRAAGLLVIPV